MRGLQIEAPRPVRILFFIVLQFCLAGVNLLEFLVELPVHLYRQPTQAFQLLVPTDAHGSFLESYSGLLRRQRLAVVTALGLFLAVVGQLSVFGFGLYSASRPSEAFASSISVSGTMYSGEASGALDCNAVNRVVAVSVNGGAPTTATCTAANGTWTVSGVSITAAGDVLTVFIDNATEDATTVTRTADGSSNLTGIDLYQNRIIVRHEDAGPITNANLGQYDADNDADIAFTSNSNSLVVNTGTELHVWTGKTYTPGGSITTNATGGDFHVDDNAVVTVDTDSTVAKALLIDSGASVTISSAKTLTLSVTSGSALTLTGTLNGPGRLTYRTSTAFPTTGTLGSTSIIRYDMVTNAMTSAIRTDYGNIEVFNSSASNRTLTVGAGTHTLAGGLTLQATGSGQANMSDSSSNAAVNIAGDLSYVSGGGNKTITSGTNTWTVSGNANFTNGIYTATSGNTLKMDGSGKNLTNGGTFYKVTIAGTITLDSATTSNILTINSGKSLTISSTLNTNSSSTIVMTGGTLDGAGTLSYKNGSTTFPSDGTLNVNVNFQPSSGSVTIPSRTYGGNVLCLDNGLTGVACTLTGNPIFNGNLSAADGGTGAVLTGTPTTVTVAGNLTGTNGGATTEVDLAGTWTVSGNVDLTGFTVVSTGTSTVVMDGTGTYTSGGFTLNNLSLTPASGKTTTLANATHPVVGNLVLGGLGTLSAGTSTIDMTGISKTIDGGGKTLSGLTLTESATLQNTDLTVSAQLSVANSKTLTLNSGRSLTLSGNSGTTLNLNTSGTVAGSGTLIYQNSATTLTTAGTLSSAFTFDVLNGNMSAPARTYGGNVTVYNNSGTSRTWTMGTAGSQTLTFSGNLDAQSTSSSSPLIRAGDTNNPNVNVTGNVTASNSAGTYTWNMGSGTWTVSGSFDASNVGTLNHNSGTLTMNGTGTLTSNGKTLNNFTTSGAGTVTLANATHTLAGNLTLAAGVTLAAGTSTIAMSGSNKTIDAGGKTLSGLTISDNTTVQTNTLGVSGTLTVAASKTLTITTVTLTDTGGDISWGNGSSTISGSGLLTFTDVSGGPGSSGTLSVPVRFDASSANIANTTFDARTYGGATELYASSGSAKSITAAAGGYTFSSTLTTTAGGAGVVTADLGAATGTTTVTGTLSIGATTSLTAPATLNVGGSFTNAGTFTHNSGTLTMNGTGTLTSNGSSLNNFTTSGGGTITLANATHTLAGNLNLGSTGLTVGSSTIVMNGTAKTIDGGGKTLNNLTISGSETIQNTDLTVSSTLQIDNAKSLTINSSRTLTLSNTGAGALTLNGALNGPGRLTYRSSTTFPTTGAIGTTLILRYDLVTNNMTSAVRTDYGTLEVFNSSSSGRTLTLGNGGHTILGDFDIQTTGTGTLTVAGDTNNPAMVVAGSVTNSATNGATTLSMGSNTWTVSSNFNLTNLTTFNHNAGTLIMDTGSGTLTSNGKTLNNLTVAANPDTVTLASATLTLAGNLSLAGAFEAGTSTVVMTGSSKTIDGGGQTLNNLTISGTTTLQNTDLVVGGQLNVADGTSLTLNSSRALILSGNSGTTLNLNSSGTVTGPGRIDYMNSTGTTLTTSGTISSAFTFDLVNGGQTIPSRTFGGSVVGLNSTGSARVLTFGTAATPTFSSNLDLQTTSSGTLLLDGATNNPATVTIGGNFTTSAANGAVTVSMGSGNWAVAGNFDLTNVTTLNHNSGTLTMSGSGKSLTLQGQSLFSFIQSGGSTTMADASVTLASNFIISSGAVTAPSSTLTIGGNFTNSGTFSANGGTVTLNTAGPTMISGATSFNNLASTTAGKAIKFQSASGGTPVFTINGTFALTGSSASHIALSSDAAGSQWLPHFAAAQSSLSYVTITDSGCDSGTANVTLDQTSSDGGNNAGCWVFATGGSGPTPDTTAPTFSNISLSSTLTSITVTWTTSEPATTQINFGLDSSYSSQAGPDTAFVTSHTATLGNLQDNHTYHLQLVAKDAAGNSGATSDLTQKTKQLSAPTLLVPIVRDGSNPSLTLTGLARGGQTIQFFLSGRLVASTLLSGSSTRITSFAKTISLKNIAAGLYRVGARAIDAQGHRSIIREQMTILVGTVSGVKTAELSRPTLYVVGRGDSLWVIARRYLGQGRLYTAIVRLSSARFPSLLTLPSLIFPNWLLNIPAGL